MLTIDDKPDRPVCSTHGPLRWGYFTDTKQGGRWVSWTLESVDGLGPVLVPHLCDDPGRPPTRWAPSPDIADTAHRGAARVREALRAKNRTDKETDHA